jgi:hypothetical protein
MKSIGHLLLLVSLACLFAGPALASGIERNLLDELPKRTPPDLVALADRELKCQQWLKVEISDEATDTRVTHALKRLRCDAEMVTLRCKYAHSPSVLKALDAASDVGA